MRSRGCRNAAIAVERASLGSFLPLLPEPSSRTRADSVAGTSTTCSPASTSSRANSSPKPDADSIAHVRSSNLAAHCNSRARCCRDARTSSSLNTVSLASTATAMCDALCGSIPMMTTRASSSMCEHRGRHSLIRSRCSPLSSHAAAEIRRTNTSFQSQPEKALLEPTRQTPRRYESVNSLNIRALMCLVVGGVGVFRVRWR